jgi:dTDP-4-dehydrorhamnose 3,5-epimerase
MIFKETELSGLFVIEPELIEDERGFFARSWTPEEFEERGLNPRLAQCNISFNKLRGTLRGLHFQAKPHEEAKLVRCTRGAMFDVAVDLRPHSPTRLAWAAVELTADNHRMLYIPEGFAHGYQTLEDATEIFYQVSEYYHSESARGLRWDDLRLGIEWPLPVTRMSPRDRGFELLAD